MKCLECFKNEKSLCFLGGIAAATLGVKAIKSQTARDLCVTGLAKGMKLHKDAQATFETMKEEAQDLCYDARVEAGYVDETEKTAETEEKEG